jgi:hypothetical protein
MKLLERIKEFENQYMFIRWASGGEYGKLVTAGEDFIEFDVIDIETMAYKETMLISSPLIFEVAIGGADISRVIAEVSYNTPMKEQ